jgi:hypothetical protein
MAAAPAAEVERAPSKDQPPPPVQPAQPVMVATDKTIPPPASTKSPRAMTTLSAVPHSPPRKPDDAAIGGVISSGSGGAVALQSLHPSAAQLAAIRACFAHGDGRVLLHIDGANGLADATRNGQPISADERACLSQALGSLGLTAGGYALSL